MTDKPVAELTIAPTANGGHVYRLTVDGRQVWLTHALATVVGRDGAKARMQRWLASNAHEVEMTGPTPTVAVGPCDEQEIQFWREYELVLGCRLWSNVEQLVGRQMKHPTTIVGWAKAFEAVDAALQELERKRGQGAA